MIYATNRTSIIMKLLSEFIAIIPNDLRDLFYPCAKQRRSNSLSISTLHSLELVHFEKQ